MKKKNESSIKGITLVALVVTIIVLLILAGVSISLVFNSDGLFSKANEAASRYNQAKEDEKTFLQGAEEYFDRYNGIYGGSSTETPAPSETVMPSPTPTPKPFVGATDTTKQTATDGEWWIPKGFMETEDSASTIKEGKVIRDKDGNEWVWIPCYIEEGGVGSTVSSATKYQRTAFTGEDIISEFTETLDSTDSTSIKKYGGFYIGRYEAGANTTVNSEDTTRKVLIQKNKYPYIYITRNNCVAKSNSFASDNNYDTNKVYTKLVSSYAWDTAISFIQKTVNDYATNSTQGNYEDHKFSEEKGPINTGKTEAVCNIYDMGGNISEYTTEECSREIWPCVERGGSSWNPSSYHSAGWRNYLNNIAAPSRTFRVTLYIK